ncbi:MAG: trypsin-like peptidase domain-containing protein [Oscillospiraceae bacterium]|nr:trypsin-like peptidase domain-containing protein [Oscillospiraceae bacterium]
MEERKNNNDWYKPYVPESEEVPEAVEMSEEESLDIFEEAGLYRPVRPQKEIKSRRGIWILVGVLCTVLLVSAIGLTAKIFSEGEKAGDSAKDFYENYGDYYEQYENSEITGINEIERADTNPNLELQLKSTVGLEPLTLQELYAKCMPSIVGISTSTDGELYGWGTGVIMTADGYIITNTHVLDDADAVEVVLHDGRTFEARLVGADAISDIGVLKIEAKGLTPAQFGDSSLVQVGDDAIAIGNPLGEQFSGTMTTGIISGVSRDIDYNSRTMTLLQTNAALNSGNSGGALFNIYGQVVGITNMKMMGSFTSAIEGVGFAIPTVTVKQMVDAILDDGAVVGRPGMGVTVYDTNGGTEEYPDGLLVNSVVKGSDAEKKGLQPEDVIIEIEGKTVTSIEVVRDVISQKQVGDLVTVKIWRAGEIIELKFALIDQNDF